MKSILKNMRKKVTDSPSPGTYPESKLSPSAAKPVVGKEQPSHVLNGDLPRHRSSRSISRSVITSLNTLRDTSTTNRTKLFIRKVRLCCYVFEFTDQPDSPQDARDKEIKRATLLELVNYLSVFKPSFGEEELEEIFDMILCNLARPLPPSTQDINSAFNPEEDEPMSEPTWPHLQVVYEFLLRLATSSETDAKLLAKHFNRPFILILLDLFDSEDPREREYLKTILHRIYGNFMGLRPFIRRAINNVFFKFIYQTNLHNGIAELLEILGSIINGFALPIKEQHKIFLSRVLLPLHKVTYMGLFHPQLSYCVCQFLEKDQELAPKVIKAILQFWPVTNSKKEMLYLAEVEDVLLRVQSHHLGDAQIPLFTQLAECIMSPHFQISERAIAVLSNDVIVRFITNSRDTLLPILAPALSSNVFAQKETSLECGGVVRRQGHWNSQIVEFTQDLLKMLRDMDATLTERWSQSDMQDSKKRDRAARDRAWDALEAKRLEANEEAYQNALDTSE